MKNLASLDLATRLALYSLFLTLISGFIALVRREEGGGGGETAGVRGRKNEAPIAADREVYVITGVNCRLELSRAHEEDIQQVALALTHHKLVCREERDKVNTA